MIEAQDLRRHFGPTVAVDGISFAAGEGEILGILGPNGAGKTTTIRMITGFLPPTSGRVSIEGLDLVEDPMAARRRIGYLPENVSLYPEMRVDEYLAYRAGLCGIPGRQRRAAIEKVVEQCLIGDVRRKPIGTLSKGYRQRVGLAQAILHDPRVLVLDEPTVGLDPKQIIAIRELIRDLGRDRTLLLSTHILPEVELLCQRVLIIDRGRIVGEGSPEALRRQAEGQRRLRLTLAGEPVEAAARLGALAGVEKVEAASRRAEETEYRLEVGESTDLREEVFRTAVNHGWVLLGLSEERASLEDVFVRLTAKEADNPAPQPSSPLAGELVMGNLSREDL